MQGMGGFVEKVKFPVPQITDYFYRAGWEILSPWPVVAFPLLLLHFCGSRRILWRTDWEPLLGYQIHCVNAFDELVH